MATDVFYRNIFTGKVYHGWRRWRQRLVHCSGDGHAEASNAVVAFGYGYYRVPGVEAQVELVVSVSFHSVPCVWDAHVVYVKTSVFRHQQGGWKVYLEVRVRPRV